MSNIATTLGALDQMASLWLSVLLDATIKASVLIVLVGMATLFFQRASAAARHLGWLIAVAMLPALPVLFLTLPGWQVLPDLSGSVSPSTQSPPTLPPSTMAGGATANDTVFERTSPSAATNSMSAATPATPQQPPAKQAMSAHWPTLLIGIWAIGCVATLTAWLAGTISLWRLRRRSRRIDDGPLAAMLERLAAQMQIRRPVQLFTSSDRQMPMQWGILRPMVLLPAAAVTWPADRLAAVLLHELAHVRRYDCLALVAAAVVRALYWFHPLVWWAVSRQRAESELACDDEVLATGCGAADYAEHVLHVTAHSSGTTVPDAAFGLARQTKLEGRVRAILGPAHNRRRATLAGTFACLVVLAVATTTLAALRVETASLRKETPSGTQRDDSAPTAVEPQSGAAITLGYVDDTAEGWRSIAGSGHAVWFERPAGDRPGAADRLVAVEIFASRYGHAEPPAEDFHVYVLDENHRLLHASPFPYSLVERGEERWYSLKLPAVELPDRFLVALAFNPHRTKGVYLSYDEDVRQSHSLVGRPTTGYEQLTENRDWMVRAVLAPDTPLANPFEPADEN